MSSIPSLSNEVTFIKHNEDICIEYRQFIAFLTNHRLENEPVIRPSNIICELRSHKNGLVNSGIERLVKFSSCIRYISKHYDSFKICRTVLDEILQTPFKLNQQSDSTLDLYNDIAGLETSVWSEDFLRGIVIGESETLISFYKHNFTDSQWQKICLFEQHYAKDHSIIDDYDETIKKKKQFLTNIKSIQKLSHAAAQQCRKIAKIQNCRKETAETISSLTFVQNSVTHSLSRIDFLLCQCLDLYSLQVNKCVSVFDNIKIKGITFEGIQLFIEVQPTEDLDHVATILSCELANKHSLLATSVIVLTTGTVEKYTCKYWLEINVHRFHLQDSYLCNSLSNSVIYTWKPNDAEIAGEPKTIAHNGINFCDCCFNNNEKWIGIPLDWRNVDVVDEWILHTPIQIQEFFTACFYNAAVVKSSPNSVSLRRKKMAKLVALFDSGLTLFNKRYCGVLQQLNTQELVVDHNAVTTVFSITSNAGTTQSLKTADRWLKAAADEDKSYFETYIKQYPMRYRSIHDESVRMHNVNLRCCYIVFFMDNLVRLTTHDDPNPGQNRTSQICTLPITLKGLPRDHVISENWHNEECQNDHLASCKCMEVVQLSKEDISLLMAATEDEASMWNEFVSLIRWGTFQFSDINEVITPLSVEGDISNVSSIANMVNGEEVHKNTLDLNQTIEDIEQKLNSSLRIDSTSYEFDGEVEEIVNITVESGCTSLNVMQKNASFLTKFKVPELLCRHPSPATGRDDDIANLKSILKDTVKKLCRTSVQNDRIIFAPDHKISKNLFKLMEEDVFYRQFLPEFPALHLRKSKIVNLFGAYKDAGLVHILKFMKDEEQEDNWMKLISIQHIETASKNITRLAIALHLALSIAFYEQLEPSSQQKFQNDMNTCETAYIEHHWGKQMGLFLNNGCSKSATFALHRDFMLHCDEIVAIITAEHLGGENGYKLLLSAVKSSLPFAFLNGASSYASFCVDLLHEHYSAGIFHKNMKMTLFSTPHRGGTTNIALDTQREIDHKDALKGFRPRSTLQTVVPRMAIVDHLADIQLAKEHLFSGPEGLSKSDETCSEDKSQGNFKINLTKKDWIHIKPLVRLIVQKNGFGTGESITPYNIYDCQEKILPLEILDTHSYNVGKYLMKKYAASKNYFGLCKEQVPELSVLDGPSHLIRKATVGKSITMRRVSYHPSKTIPKDNEEYKRQAMVKKKSKIIDCLSSTMNTCQALVNPDGSKASVQKSAGIKKALLAVLHTSYQNPNADMDNNFDIAKKLKEDYLITSGYSNMSNEFKQSIHHATIEFAGIKFKTRATSGKQYLKHIENGVIKSLMSMFPNLSQIIVCEEKYTFTPDTLKSETRQKRNKNVSLSIAHLKVGEDIISSHKLSKSAVISTGEGKKMISNYLARNISSLSLHRNISVVVDSELIKIECSCEGACSCIPYTHPVKADFCSNGFQQQHVLYDIRQRKGEAELAQVDWLNTISDNLGSDESTLAVVTSGDIDSVVAHMFALSIHWQRNPDNSFKNSVYVLLQKSNPELYNITSIIERIEARFGFKYAAVNVAVLLCMGGNDFVPKLYGMGHVKWLTTALKIPDALKHILHYEFDIEGKPTTAKVNSSIYCDIIKHMYCPKSIDPLLFSVQEVRQMSVKLPGKEFRHPNMWMPPESAIGSMVELLNCVIEYMFTAWFHANTLPEFLGRGCLIKNQYGDVHYDFGNESKIADQSQLLALNENTLLQKICTSRRKTKRPLQTPDKDMSRKRKPLTSTPIKMRRKSTAKKALLLSSESEMTENITNQETRAQHGDLSFTELT